MLLVNEKFLNVNGQSLNNFGLCYSFVVSVNSVMS